MWGPCPHEYFWMGGGRQGGRLLGALGLRVLFAAFLLSSHVTVGRTSDLPWRVAWILLQTES